jgi:hypothetical protein
MRPFVIEPGTWTRQGRDLREYEGHLSETGAQDAHSIRRVAARMVAEGVLYGREIRHEQELE